MKELDIRVISVIINLKQRYVSKNILSLNMKVSDILVISVIFKLQQSKVFGIICWNIRSERKKWNTFVISAFTKLRNNEVFRDIFSLNTKVSSIPVICVITKLQHREVFENMLILNTETDINWLTDKNMI